jgi:hypothetical protein
MADSKEFFGSLSQLRQGARLSADVVQRAREHCRGGKVVRNLAELYDWMISQNPETPHFDNRIATGRYPIGLAAFVTSCRWEEWKKHAVYALHGEVYLSRLRIAKPTMPSDQYRDNFAGASMHRANGLMHMARCAKAEGMAVLIIPIWSEPRSLADVAALAVADMRTSCSLRSEKYGQKGGSENAVKAYQAALRNLADALEIHADITEEADGEAKRMSAWLRERATNLALTDQRLLVACAAGEALNAADERTVTRDLRLAETAARAIAVPEGQGGLAQAMCATCGTASATHMGFNCRCICLCADCVAAAGGRILECPLCNEFTEFIRQD